MTHMTMMHIMDDTVSLEKYYTYIVIYNNQKTKTLLN